MREHIVGLTAVFLAMILGLLVGLGLGRPGSLEQRLERANEQMRTLLEENGLLQSQLGHGKEFQRSCSEELLSGLLQGMRIAVVYVGFEDEPAYDRDLEDMLVTAGADVASRTILRPDVEARINAHLASALEIPESEATPERAARVIARVLALGDKDETVDKLRRAGIISRSGNYTLPAHRVVIIGAVSEGMESRLNDIDAALIEELGTYGLNVYGCEASDAQPSVMRPYQSADIGTVDNIDTVQGQFSLIMALHRGLTDDFGIKPTAKKAFPPIRGLGQQL